MKKFDDLTDKIKEIGDTPVALKHVIVLVTIAVLVVRPPMVWRYGYSSHSAVSSQGLHRV